MSDDRQQTKSDNQLPTLRKLAYGFGDTGFTLTSTCLGFFYLFFLTDVVHLDPARAGASLFIGRLWNALNYPLIGSLSDRTQTRWGRRRPYLLFGAVPLGLAFAALWFVPPFSNQLALTIYFTAMYMLFDSLFVLGNIPYAALTPELTSDYDERTSLHSYRMFFSIAFGLVGAVAPLTIAQALGGDTNAALAVQQRGFRLMGLIFGLLAILPMVTVFLTTREQASSRVERTTSLRESFQIARSNRAFWYTAGIYLLTWIPIDLIELVLVYLVTYWLGLRGEVDVLFFLIFFTAVLCLPLWVKLAACTSKPVAYRWGMVFLIAALLGLILIPVESLRQASIDFAGLTWRNVYTVAVIAGIGVSAAHALPLAMLPDVMEWDELYSGRRQEGAYYGIISFINTLVDALDPLWFGALLTWAGYVPNGSQNATTLNVIRLVNGAVPTVVLVIGIAVSWRYPLTRERHRQIVSELAQRINHSKVGESRPSPRA